MQDYYCKLSEVESHELSSWVDYVNAQSFKDVQEEPVRVAYMPTNIVKFAGITQAEDEYISDYYSDGEGGDIRCRD